MRNSLLNITLIAIYYKYIFFFYYFRYLLSQGADRDLLTDEGETPADLG